MGTRDGPCICARPACLLVRSPGPLDRTYFLPTRLMVLKGSLPSGLGTQPFT